MGAGGVGGKKRQLGSCEEVKVLFQYIYVSFSFYIYSNVFIKYGCVALAELCLLGSQTQNPDVGIFWPQLWPFILILGHRKFKLSQHTDYYPSEVETRTLFPALPLY